MKSAPSIQSSLILVLSILGCLPFVLGIPICGDGIIEIFNGEDCDDANHDDNDGCSSQCRIEAGFACEEEPSICKFVCGNGLVDVHSTETCDDDNLSDGDGCSHVCATERGYICLGQPSICSIDCEAMPEADGCEIHTDQRLLKMILGFGMLGCFVCIFFGVCVNMLVMWLTRPSRASAGLAKSRKMGQKAMDDQSHTQSLECPTNPPINSLECSTDPPIKSLEDSPEPEESNQDSFIEIEIPTEEEE